MTDSSAMQVLRDRQIYSHQSPLLNFSLFDSQQAVLNLYSPVDHTPVLSVVRDYRSGDRILFASNERSNGYYQHSGEGYPELSDFAFGLCRSAELEHREKWPLKKAIWDIRETLSDSGFVRPMALLGVQGIRYFSFLAEAVRKGELSYKFDFTALRNHFSQSELLIEKSDISPSSQNWYGYVTTADFDKGLENGESASSLIIIIFFKPANFKLAEAGKDQSIPDEENRWFRMRLPDGSTGLKPSEHIADFSISTFDCSARSQEMFRRDIESHQTSSLPFYFRVADPLTAALTALAPLPVEQLVERQNSQADIQYAERIKLRGEAISAALSEQQEIGALLTSKSNWTKISSRNGFKSLLEEGTNRPNEFAVLHIQRSYRGADRESVKWFADELKPAILQYLETLELTQDSFLREEAYLIIDPKFHQPGFSRLSK